MARKPSAVSSKPSAKKGAAAKKPPATKTAGKKPATKAKSGAKKAKAAPQPAASPAPAPTVAARDAALTIVSIFPSPLNPRRAAAPAEADAALENSIVENGLLQPILVRPAPEPRGEARYEIICGARRHGAIARAVASGRLPADWPVPVRIREASDEDLVVLAGMENLDRADMHPLDEALLFDALRKILRAKEERQGRPEADVAAKLHVNERTVFRRLQLLRLAPELQAALRKDELSLGQAQAFALGHHNDQRAYWKKARGKSAWHGMTEPGEIRRRMTNERVPLAAAIFDAALYTGEILEDAETGARYFGDKEAFEALQSAAIDAKVEALAKKWPWALRLTDKANPWDYQDASRKSDKDAGAIVFVQHGTVRTREGVLKPETVKARQDETRRKERAKTKADAGARPPLTQAQLLAVKRVKTRALRMAVAEDAHAALCLAILGLAGGRGVDLRRETWAGPEGHYEPTDAEEARRSEALRTILEAIPESDEDSVDFDPIFGLRDAEEQARVFQALRRLEAGQLARILAGLVADLVTVRTTEGKVGDSALTVAIAEEVGAASHVPTFWAPDADYFEAYGKEQLIALAVANGLGDGFNKLAKGQMVERLTKQAPGFWSASRFLETRFAGDADLLAAFAGPRPVFDGPAPAPAAPSDASAAGDEIDVDELEPEPVEEAAQ